MEDAVARGQAGDGGSGGRHGVEQVGGRDEQGWTSDTGSIGRDGGGGGVRAGGAGLNR
jgi:hypothetical protein